MRPPRRTAPVFPVTARRASAALSFRALRIASGSSITLPSWSITRTAGTPIPTYRPENYSMGWLPPLALAARPHVKASLKPHSFSAIQRLASLPILDVSYLLYDPNDQSLLILPRTLLLAGGLVGRPMFCGVAFNAGIRPGLICSGIKVGCAWVAGSDCVCPRSVVIAGMHPDRADGPWKTSERLVATSALKRSNQVG